MQVNQLGMYIANILNIDTKNPYIVDDIIEELESISDLKSFKEHLKAQITLKEYQYLTSFQKFLSISKKYKERELKKIVLNNPQIKTFSESLYKKTCDVFDEVNWMVQSGNDIDSDIVKKFIYNNFYGKDKEIQVLKKVGSKQEILNFVKNNKYSLEKKIQEIVTSFTILKHTKSPALEYKDKEVMKRLSNG